MDEEHCKIIRSNYKYLIEDITDNEKIDEVCNFLWEKNILTRSMKEKILCQNRPSRRASALLDMMESRGSRAFPALYEACKQAGLVRSADLLRMDKAPHQLVAKGPNHFVAVSRAGEQPLPDKWITEEHFTRVENQRISVKTVAKDSNLPMYETYQSHLNSPGTYPMHHKYRGRALIIVNEHFLVPKPKQRRGSKWDRSGLEQLFKGLGFEVDVHDDEKAAEINAILERETEIDHREHDCFVLFILTFGKKGIVFGTDWEPITIKSIVDKFYLLEDLQNKPKLFFFQACQGGNADRGHFVPEGAACQLRGVEESSQSQGNDDKPLVSDSDQDPTQLQRKDCFIMRSSPDGTRSQRNTEWGSWFAQAIIYVFSEYAYKCEFEDLFLKVNDLLSRAETQAHSYKNSAEFQHSKDTKLYFFPGLCD